MSLKASQYRVTVRPAIERAEAIEAAKATPDYMAKFFFYKSSEHDLPVIKLPIELLVYRLANGRTRDDQLSLIAQKRFKDGYFDPSRQEDVDVQQAQHDILFRFSQEGQGESVVPIYGELKKKKKQTEPILITSAGVIVNGNRRMSAMRELLKEPDTDGFNHVSCMVLPPGATETDLLEVEFKLQMAPETRLPYSWTNEARSCKLLRDAGRSIEHIAKMKDDDPKRVEMLIEMYKSADIYLNEWLEKPGAFNQLDATRQAFKQIVTRRQARRPEQEKEVAQAFDFFIVENRDALEERAYDFINVIESNPSGFAERYAESSGIALTSGKSSDVGDLLIEIDIPTEEKSFVSVIEHLREIRKDKQVSESALQTVDAICEAMAAEKKKPGEAAVNFARQALKKLTSIDPATAHKKTLRELCEILESIVQRAESLLEQAEHSDTHRRHG